MVLFSIVLSFFCVLIFYCFNKRISVSPKPGMVEDWQPALYGRVCVKKLILILRYRCAESNSAYIESRGISPLPKKSSTRTESLFFFCKT